MTGPGRIPHDGRSGIESTPKSLVVAGVMSGTSADGIDVAVCRISAGGAGPLLEVMSHRSFPYLPAIREAVLLAMSDASMTVAALARLNWRLGELYAEAVEQTCAGLRPDQKLDLIGLHGQTIYHQSTAMHFLDAPVRATWQTGEPAVLAERLGVPVVSDFRTADLAAGGQGAPLVPMLDFEYFRHRDRTRVLLNLGGIANITVLPCRCTLAQVTAFDTGPSNMVLDALAERLLDRAYDPEGRTASQGQVLPALLAALLADPYFAAPAPKSCGREQFGTQYTRALIEANRGARPADLLATATELTAQSVARAVLPFAPAGTELIASGGGTRNTFLMQRLRRLVSADGVTLSTTDDHGLASVAKEAAAFALLAWLTWHRLPGNVPSATGASHPAILGRITWV